MWAVLAHPDSKARVCRVGRELLPAGPAMLLAERPRPRPCFPCSAAGSGQANHRMGTSAVQYKHLLCDEQHNTTGAAPGWNKHSEVKFESWLDSAAVSYTVYYQAAAVIQNQKHNECLIQEYQVRVRTGVAQHFKTSQILYIKISKKFQTILKSHQSSI